VSKFKSIIVIALLLIAIYVVSTHNAGATYGGCGNGRSGFKPLPVNPVKVHVYRTVDGLDLEGDFYLPVIGEPPYPVVVLIHGGAWKGGDKSVMAYYAGKFVERGYACFSINYRLTPDGKFPNNVNDCKAAVQWLRRWALKLNIDPDRIAAAGSSAGGHLSAFIGATDDDDGFNAEEFTTSGRIQAVVPCWGVFDFGLLTDLDSMHHWDLLYMHPEDITFEEHLGLMSPITYVTEDDPPVFMIHGEDDAVVLVNQSYAYQDALEAAGVMCGLLVVKNAGHGLQKMLGLEMEPSGDEAIESAIDFLDEVL